MLIKVLRYKRTAQNGIRCKAFRPEQFDRLDDIVATLIADPHCEHYQVMRVELLDGQQTYDFLRYLQKE